MKNDDSLEALIRLIVRIMAEEFLALSAAKQRRGPGVQEELSSSGSSTISFLCRGI